MKTEPMKFATEADLCAAFIAALGPEWTAYAETAGWDILLSRKEDACQIGIQAKLRLNAKVMAQAVESRWASERPGPDYRAILVPWDQANELADLAPYCGLTVLRVSRRAAYRQTEIYPQLPLPSDLYRSGDDWYEMMPISRCKLPEYIPDSVAGSPSPVQLTRWKIAAMRLCILLDRTGYLVREDFKAQGIDIRRWIGEKWLQSSAAGFVAGPNLPAFRANHPRVWGEIEADENKWRRAAPLMVARG